MQGKVVLITGASCSIGAAAAQIGGDARGLTCAAALRDAAVGRALGLIE